MTIRLHSDVMYIPKYFISVPVLVCIIKTYYIRDDRRAKNVVAGETLRIALNQELAFSRSFFFFFFSLWRRATKEGDVLTISMAKGLIPLSANLY